MPDRHDHPSAHDRAEATRRHLREAAILVQIGIVASGQVGDLHALQQAAIDDPTLTEYRQEVDRQDQKRYADYRKVLDEQRAGRPELRQEPTRGQRRPRDDKSRDDGSRATEARGTKPRAPRERRRDRDR